MSRVEARPPNDGCTDLALGHLNPPEAGRAAFSSRDERVGLELIRGRRRRPDGHGAKLPLELLVHMPTENPAHVSILHNLSECLAVAQTIFVKPPRPYTERWMMHKDDCGRLPPKHICEPRKLL